MQNQDYIDSGYQLSDHYGLNHDRTKTPFISGLESYRARDKGCSRLKGLEKKTLEEYDLLRCIEKGLEPFGTHVKQTIFWKMSILHNYSRNEISDNPEILISVIRETLSDSSPAVEESIAREIRAKFNLPYEESLTMGDAIASAKRLIIDVYLPVRTV